MHVHRIFAECLQDIRCIFNLLSWIMSATYSLNIRRLLTQSIRRRPNLHVKSERCRIIAEYLLAVCENCSRQCIFSVRKGPLRVALFVYCYLENQFYVFQTAPVVVYRLMTSVFSRSQDRCYWLSRCLCKHFTIWRMTQNIIGNVALSYQVNPVIEIPNITENYINSHVFTCRLWVSAMLI